MPPFQGPSFLRQRPDIWIKTRNAPATLRQVMTRFNMSEDSATRMLAALVRDRRLVTTQQDGRTVWDVPPTVRKLSR